MDLSKNSFSSRMGSGIYESETQRLQREADNFTKKLEHERKRFMILEDQLKQAQSEFDEKKISLKKVRPPTAQ
jgi:chromosome segregation ATPase